MITRVSAALTYPLVAMLAAACGGSPAEPGQPATSNSAPTSPSLSTAAAPTGTPASIASPTDAPPDAPPASFAAGPVDFRVVNVIAEGSTVDVYARTQGLVEAVPVQAGLAYGQVTEYFAPPDPGTVVVTSAGAGDPTCVGDCPHFVSSSSTGFGEGDARTIILYDEGTQELWHNPDPGSVGTTGNALRPADPSAALLFTSAVGLTNADFGLRLAFEGEDGCQRNRVSENVLVGGNQIGEFAFDGGSVSVTLHDNGDLECADAPVGGPFDVSAATGERVVLLLYGELGAIEALILDL